MLDNTRFFSSKDEASQFHNALGLMYKSEGRGDEAVREFHNAIIAKPSSYAYSNLATHYYDNKDYDQAIQYYQEALSLEPDNARMYFNMGQACLAAQRFDEALISFEKSVTFDQRVHPLAWYNLALLYIKKGEESKAKKAMEKYFKLYPQDREPRRLLPAHLKH
jgi:tetratricopeptide (TPR) repeat protein